MDGELTVFWHLRIENETNTYRKKERVNLIVEVGMTKLCNVALYVESVISKTQYVCRP